MQKIVKRAVVAWVGERLPKHFFDAGRQKRKAEQHAQDDDGEMCRPPLMQRSDEPLKRCKHGTGVLACVRYWRNLQAVVMRQPLALRARPTR